MGAVTGVLLCCVYFWATSVDDNDGLYGRRKSVTKGRSATTTPGPLRKLQRITLLPTTTPSAPIALTPIPPSVLELQPQGNAKIRGRSSSDGQWLKFSGPHAIFGYSAFYDRRPSLDNPPVVVRVIVVSDVVDVTKQLFCRFRYEGHIIANTSSRVTPQPIGAGVYIHAKLYKEFVYTCPVDSPSPPVSVAIVVAPADDATLYLPVEIPAKWGVKKDFGVCVSVSYWNHTTDRIVEWMELNRIFGVNHVTVYNNSLSAEAARVFERYAASGFVDFRQSANFIDDPAETNIHLHMSPVINDCMYRNMNRFSKILVIDLDEMIVPRANDSLADMIVAIETSQPERHPARTYVFRNAYFFFDWPPDATQPARLATLRHRTRTPPSDEGVSVKSIVDPQACAAMHNHYCWTFTPRFDTDAKEVAVANSVGMNQHYKRCHLDAYVKRGTCATVMANGVKDDAMLKYKERLMQQVDKQLKELNLGDVRR